MELMSTSFDKFYKYVYCSLDDVIPEEILGKITLAVSVPYRMPCKCFVSASITGFLLNFFLKFITDCESTESLERKLENNPQR